MPNAAEIKDFDEYNQFHQLPKALKDSPLPLQSEKEIATAIMNLFVAVAIADQKFLDVEAETCVKAFRSCFGDDINHRFITEYDFVVQAELIRHILNGPGKKYWLGTQYMTLRAYPDYQILLDRLWKISVCDGKLDSREADIIDFFAYFWKRRNTATSNLD